MELRNLTDSTFTDISSEEWRVYTWESGFSVTINLPLYLHVSGSGGARVLDDAGVSHYIPSGWKHLAWRAKDNAPHFVK